MKIKTMYVGWVSNMLHSGEAYYTTNKIEAMMYVRNYLSKYIYYSGLKRDGHIYWVPNGHVCKALRNELGIPYFEPIISYFVDSETFAIKTIKNENHANKY